MEIADGSFLGAMGGSPALAAAKLGRRSLDNIAQLCNAQASSGSRSGDGRRGLATTAGP
jgi:hypothetical protein